MNWGLLSQTLLLSAGVTLFSAIAGFGAALWISSVGRWTRIVSISGAIAVLALPPFLMTNALLDLASGGIFGGAGLPFGLFPTMLVMTALHWPLTALALWAAWSRLDPALIENDPCVIGWQFLRHVLWPLGSRALGVAAVLTFVLAMNNFSVASVLQAKTYPVEVWIRFNTGLNWTSALLASWPMIVAPAALLWWVSRKGVPWPGRRARSVERLIGRQLGPAWVCVGAAFIVVGFFVSLCFPLAQLATAKGTWAALPGAFEASRTAAWSSLAYAGLAAIVCCFAGLLLASIGRAQWFLPALWLLFFLPGTVLGIVLAIILSQRGLTPLREGMAAVILVLFARYVPLAWGASRIAINSIDPALLDVARLDGATVWQRIRHVYWPQSSKQILAGAYAVFLLALWEIECVLPVVPPGGDTLAMRIFNLLHYGHTPEINALCLLLVGMALAPLGMYLAKKAMTRAP